MSRRLMTLTAALVLAAPIPAHAQGRGGGVGPAGPPPTAKAAAPVDLTGYWVSEIVDEWRYRVSPLKGDVLYVPINAEARRIAMEWDPDKDTAEGKQCKAYGAVGVMQRPGRIHIEWQDDNTLKLDTDAGTQTRLIHFAAAAPEALPAPSLQGYSVAQWQGPGRGRGRAAQAPRAGNLKIETTDMLPGYLRKNGVPYSDKTVLTEYIDAVTGQQNDTYLVWTQLVDDPVYLNQTFVRSYQFKKQPDAAGWEPTPCLAK